MVSSNNVAFNASANTATISGATFNLNSAYLTGAWNNGLQLRVEGYANGTKTYDNTYTINATGPTLIDFNYLGVDSVDFNSFGGTQNPGFTSSGEQFVMDNLSVTLVPEPSAPALLVIGVSAFTMYWRDRRIKPKP